MSTPLISIDKEQHKYNNIKLLQFIFNINFLMKRIMIMIKLKISIIFLIIFPLKKAKQTYFLISTCLQYLLGLG